MEAIRKWQKIYVILLIISVFSTVWFFRRFMLEMAIVFGCANIVLLILLIKQNQLLKDAELIRDNCILMVSSGVISTENGEERSVAEQTVVSVFGIVMGNKIYKWGSDGVHGVRLSSVVIEKAHIRLTFGDGTKTMWVRLLHGLVDEQEIFEVKERLWQETGVTAEVNGW
ncbi:MAG: hypothetical protein ACOX47_09890 [Bacillota bacterium]